MKTEAEKKFAEAEKKAAEAEKKTVGRGAKARAALMSALALTAAGLAVACDGRVSSPPAAATPPRAAQFVGRVLLPAPESVSGVRVTDRPCAAEVRLRDGAVMIRPGFPPNRWLTLRPMPKSRSFFQADAGADGVVVAQFGPDGLLRSITRTDRDADGNLRYGIGHHGQFILECAKDGR